MGSQTQPKLPVIDFSKENLKQGCSWKSVSTDVQLALEDYGCFVALYNKVTPELHDSIFSESKELYDLPMETKVTNTSTLFGYGYGGGFASLPLFENFGFANATTVEATESFSNLMWPNGNERFCKSFLSYSKLLAELSHEVLRMVFGNYGVEKYCKAQLDELVYHTRFCKYSAPMNNDSNTGLHPHTDKNILTMLDQNQVSGLEVQTKDGDWIVLEASHPAIIVIAGDGLMAWSNGRINSPPHRVTMKGNEDRYSIGMFAFKNGIVETPEELVDDEHPLQFKPFDNHGYLQYCAGEGMKYKNPIKAYCGV